ncbi:unnamed protein product, partial [Durusdinium trenchii]
AVTTNNLTSRSAMSARRPKFRLTESFLTVPVPLLEDNVEESWVFDTVSKKHLFSRMWTIMNGSVVTFGSGPSTGTKRSGKENQQPKKRAKAKAKAGAGGGSANAGSVLASIQMPEEKDLTATTIKCEVGVRSKLWIDDLLQCIRHSVDSLKKLLRGDADSFDFDSLRSRMLRLGLLFCFTGTVKVSTARGCKAHKKWSGLRAALKEYALWQVVQDMRGSLEAAMHADAAGGACAGLQNLEAAVSMHQETNTANKLNVNDKLKQWAPAVEQWLSGEAQSPLRSDNPLKVSLHASFGKIKASVLYSSCTCRRGASGNSGVEKDGETSTCSIHADKVVLTDVMFEVAKQVHEVFNDQFIAFANLLAEET